MQYVLLLLLVVSSSAFAQYYDPDPSVDLSAWNQEIQARALYLETGMTPGDWNKLSNTEKEKLSAQVQCNEIRHKIDEQLALEHAGHVGFYNWRSLREIENRKTACGGMTYRLGESPNDTYPAEYAKTQSDSEQDNRSVPYPMDALRKREQGTVQLRLTLDSEGNVISATVYQSSGFEDLDKAAIHAAEGWRYPAASRQKLKPGDALVVPVTFSLSN